MRTAKRTTVFIMALVGALALGGCVTETSSYQKKQADPQQIVKNLTNLGIGYLRQRDFTRAKDNLSKALAIDPKSTLVHTTFGVLFQLEGESELAEEHFKKAIKSDPKFSQARNNYGAFLFTEGRYNEAIDQLQAAASDRFYAKRPQVFENLGVCYLKIGADVKAEESFVRAVKLNFSQGRALLELSSIRFDQQNYVESKSLYDRHAAVSQQSARSLWMCVQLARKFENLNSEASCALVLKNIFPASEEYKKFKRTT